MCVFIFNLYRTYYRIFWYKNFWSVPVEDTILNKYSYKYEEEKFNPQSDFVDTDLYNLIKPFYLLTELIFELLQHETFNQGFDAHN